MFYLKRVYILTIVLFVIILCPTFSQQIDSATLNDDNSQKFPLIESFSPSFRVLSGLDLTLQSSAQQVFQPLSYGVTLLGWLPFKSWPVAPALGVNYSFIPLNTDGTISTIAAGIGGLYLLNWNKFDMSFSMLAGINGSFANEVLSDPEGIQYPNQSGASGYLATALDFDFRLSAALTIGAGVMYHNLLGLYHSVRIHLGATLDLYGLKSKLVLSDLELDPIFPTLLNYYDKTPVGSILVTNNERFMISNLCVYLSCNELTQGRRLSPIVDSLEPGESARVKLYALFDDKLLDVKTMSSTGVIITADYDLLKNNREKQIQHIATVFDRNSLVWNDSAKVAAFINPSDPFIRGYSTSIAKIVRSSGLDAVDPNFRLAVAVFEALSLSGVSYVVDPNRPNYINSSEDISIVDFVQFPWQTLEQGGGDCDDLSVLYCAILESVGVRTALITVPGHIFTAFMLSSANNEISDLFENYGGIKDVDGQIWIPVETTNIGKPFLNAWNQGIKQWRESQSRKTAEFLRTDECWDIYPTASPLKPNQSMSTFLYPNTYSLESAYKYTLETIAAHILEPRLAELEEKLQQSKHPEVVLNRIGILYAQLGQYSKAITVLEDALSICLYAPAMVNLANIYLFIGDFDSAKLYLKNAEQIIPAEPSVLLGLAQIAYSTNDFSTAKHYFERIQAENPAIAEEYFYLVDGISTETRGTSNVLQYNKLIWLVEE